jgi:hypothetical protein
LSGAGYGGMLAAALWPELEKSGSGKGSGGLALALGGAIGGWAQGGVAGVLNSRGKATRRTNFGGGWWWSAVRFERGKENSGRPRLYPSGGTGDVDEAVRAEHSSKQLRGQLRGGVRGGGACPPCNRGGRARDPLDHCSSPLSPLFCPLVNFSQNLN